jgi:hypothetical protein
VKVGGSKNGWSHQAEFSNEIAELLGQADSDSLTSVGASDRESIVFLERLLSLGRRAQRPQRSESDDLELLNRLSQLAVRDRVQALPEAVPLPQNDAAALALLHELKRLAEDLQGALGRRPISLFDAMLVGNLENPHSDFIAWLLDPRGPLTQAWLTQRLFEQVAPEVSWPGMPTVDREVPCEDGRADIVILWDTGFKIVIENKVLSPEGKGQISNYLKGFRIDSKKDGRVIYLTPCGKRSKSKGDCEDGLVVEMGYEQLAELVRSGLSSEASNRGRVYAEEFLACVDKLLNRSRIMDNIEQKRDISEVSRVYMANLEALEAIKERAIEESAALLEWMGVQATKRLKAILGDGMHCTVSAEGSIYATMPSWTVGDIQYGIAYYPDFSIRNRTLADQSEDHYVAVLLTLVGDEEWLKKSDGEPVSEKLNDILSSVWPHKADLKDWDAWDPLWRRFPIPNKEDGDFANWAEEILSFMEELAKKLGPTLNSAAAELCRGKN